MVFLLEVALGGVTFVLLKIKKDNVQRRFQIYLSFGEGKKILFY